LTCEAQSTGVAKATTSICNAAGRKNKETKITWPSRGKYQMPHIAPQKIVDWQQNSGGENAPLLFTRSLSL
jgi:hypothetical protein